MIPDLLADPLVFTALALWTLAWKSVSLWRSARRGQRVWFGVLLITNTLGILDMVYIFLIARDKKSMIDPQASSRIEAINKERAEEKQRALDDLLKLFDRQEKVTNNDVEKLLGIADSTAERYLQELESAGKIKQHGQTGRGIYYTKA